MQYCISSITAMLKTKMSAENVYCLYQYLDITKLFNINKLLIYLFTSSTANYY